MAEELAQANSQSLLARFHKQNRTSNLSFTQQEAVAKTMIESQRKQRLVPLDTVSEQYGALGTHKNSSCHVAPSDSHEACQQSRNKPLTVHSKNSAVVQTQTKSGVKTKVTNLLSGHRLSSQSSSVKKIILKRPKSASQSSAQR